MAFPEFCYLPLFTSHTDTHHLDSVLQGPVSLEHSVKGFVLFNLLQALVAVFVVHFDENIFALNIFQRNGPFIVLDLQIVLVPTVVEEN